MRKEERNQRSSASDTVSIPESAHEVDNDDEAGGDGAVNGQV